MNLPQNWIMTTIGNVTSPRGVKLKPSQMEDAPFIGLQHVEAHTMRLIGIGRTRDVKSSGSYFRRDDVLYGRLRPYLNKIYMPDFDGLASGEFIVFPSQQFLDNTYLKYFLNQWEFASFATRINAGDRPRVDFIQFSGYPIPLPPFPEQRRIVAEIEKQLTRLDASVASLERVRANLRRYRTSVLKAACEGKLVATEAELARAEGRQYEHADELLERILKERRALWESQPSGRRKYKEAVGPDVSGLPPLPEGWAWVTVEQTILGTPQNGLYKPRSHYGCGMPILRIDDFQDFSLKDRGDLRRLTITSGEANIYGLLSNQLVINRVNSLSHLGKCLVVPDSILPAVFESNMMRITTNRLVDSLYIACYLRSPNGRSRLTSDAKWAVNQASINQKDVCVTPIPLPPLVEQRRIVAEVERRLSIIQRAEEAVDASLKRAERLRQSVLKQAFCGRLVPQDLGDEPASALLERIRTERAEAQAATEANLKRGRRARRNARAVS